MLINATLEEDILKSLFIITQKSYKKYHLLLYSYIKNKTHRYGYMKVKESNIFSYSTVFRASHKNFNQIYLGYYCDLKFNSKFWDDAIKLNKSDCLGSWKYEYIRITNFENKLKNNG